MDSREKFNTVFTLLARQPWLGAKHQELVHMLFDECQCERSREMLINIVSGFFYLSGDQYNRALDSLAQEVVAQEDYKLKSQVVAMAVDSGADSSHEVLYNLKFVFSALGWLDFKGVSLSTAAYKTYTRTGRNNIVVVDDFVGSGKTVINRHKLITSQFKDNKVTDYTISFKVLVSTQAGLQAVRDEGIAITAQHEIKKAIDDVYPEQVAAEYRALMLALEDGLSKEYGGREMPSLGYNGAQAAFCRERANTPNSVFPIFWWPFKTNLDARMTILLRAMGDA
ncbi:hypothetical protein [Pseudomonas fluorescens]|jgi:hypothetical protein|uniref:phosphoribosyltransferase-like protein n=1 Tax=Pseudomonas fluorescens TaxID=294 RepID=UPI00054B45A9|nr:hypothetical protein [Pseudomonas fluorescens]KII31758.1 hypothetical protein RY26_21455 [Pseudomonas fluorescens]